MATRLFIIALALGLTARPSLSVPTIPPGKTVCAIYLASLPDRALVGQRVDVYSRRVANNSAIAPKLKLILEDVLLISSPENNEWGASTRKVELALDAKEEEKLRKASERVGVDLLVQPHLPK